MESEALRPGRRSPPPVRRLRSDTTLLYTTRAPTRCMFSPDPAARRSLRQTTTLSFSATPTAVGPAHGLEVVLLLVMRSPCSTIQSAMGCLFSPDSTP